MAYIRDKKEELTGYQEAVPFRKSIDLQCDFVMVYGIDDTMPERVRQYKEAGYVVHLMTGISWGEYQDYLDGKWDGKTHWDEAQTDRNGKQIIHNPTVPYMVPTISFSNYLTEKLKKAIDVGVEALHLEEPEFWDYGGYSEAFKREYEIYYQQPWAPPHKDLDTRYKCSKLMAYLYARAISRISAELKEYTMVKYGKNIPFYVPTHSLLNYTQWKIMSPEAALIDIPTVDGCIAQVWMGTSRTANVYEGRYRERTFETAYLEYGIMQELVRGTGRKIWFLHDPIEDRPLYEWEDYEKNYIQTVVASFLHPEVHRYEICPWPHRVFDGVYPRIQEKIAEKDESSVPASNARAIPPHYATMLASMIQLCGDMEQKEYEFENEQGGIGLFMSDSGLFQRSFPDGIAEKDFAKKLSNSAVLDAGGVYEENQQRINEMMKQLMADDKKLYDYVQSGAFPQFFGLALPLLKYGLPVQPVQLDNISRFASYLNGFSTLILSYEYIKPASPDINASLASWVRNGGNLIYVGDDSDPFHQIESFWKKAGYDSPSQHLFELCGLSFHVGEGIYPVGRGSVSVMRVMPAKISADRKLAGQYRSFIHQVLQEKGFQWDYTNHLTLHRGPYIISAVMDESVSAEEKIFTGLFADMLENDYRIITQKTVAPDENAILFNLEKIENEQMRIIGTSARIYESQVSEQGIQIEAKAADRIKVFIRIRTPKPVLAATAADEKGKDVPLSFDWDEQSRTVLFSYNSTNQRIYIKGDF